MSAYLGWDYVGQDGYYGPAMDTWPWWHSVGQAPQSVAVPGRAEIIERYDIARDPNWPGARALVRSTIQSVLGVDAIFDQIFRQIVQHLLRQGFLDSKSAGAVSRPDYVAKVRAWVRQSLYYADVDAIIDVAARQLIRYARSHGKGPFG